MMDAETHLDNYSVKEVLNLIVLPRLDAMTVKQDQRFDSLETLVKTNTQNTTKRLDDLEAWKNRGVGILTFVVAVLIPVSVPVILSIVGAIH